MAVYTSFKFLFLYLTCFTSCESLNILGFATYDGNSHWLVMKSVFEALANAGHHVTIITPYSLAPRNNISIIDLSKRLPLRTNSFNYLALMKEYYNPLLALHIIPKLSLGQCDKSHVEPEVRKLLSGPRKFDVVITEIFGADCDAVFAYLLKVPLISVIASTNLPWASGRVGNPENPSYVTHILLPYSEIMSFHQRLVNFAYYVYSSAVSLYVDVVTTSLNRKHFGDEIPRIGRIVQNTSLIFVNSHYTVDIPRPFVPNVVEIGGIHLPPVKPLPKDLADFMNNSKHGVIFFSLGSIIKASSMPNETINAIKNTFAELEFDVLWKFEDETLDVPSNVHVRRWFPQRDILAHPKMKLAILHGGLMGVYEAVDTGVPVLGMPLFFDQKRNIMNLVAKGVALNLEIDKITKPYFKENIKRIVDDERFKKRAEELSERFHDRVTKPSENVVFWTEYVVKHKGAQHLRSPAAEVPGYQKLLLDIFAFILLSFLVFMYVTIRIMKFIMSFISPSHKVIIEKNKMHLKAS